MQSVFLACVPHLSTQSAPLGEASLKNVLSSTLVQTSGETTNSTAPSQLCPSQLGAGGDAATEGQCCSSAGATQCGSSVHIPHVIAICSVISQQPDRQHDIDHFGWGSARSRARAFSLSPSWFCLVSFPSPLSATQTRPPGRCPYRSTQLLRDILSHCGHRVFSHLRQSWGATWFRINPQLSESSFALRSCGTTTQMMTLIRGTRRMEAKSAQRQCNCCSLDEMPVFCHFHWILHNFVGNFHFYIKHLHFSPLWLLGFTGCYIMKVSLKVKLLRFPGFPGNMGPLSPWLENK